MFRGQAFDTFKLMIAAVIAVAILGILLGILGGISPPGQGFTDTTTQLIGEAVRSPGAIRSSSGEVSFTGGDEFPGSIFEDTSGGRNIKYEYASGFCGTGVSCTNLCCVYTQGSQTFLKINRNFNAKIYVCCKQSTSDECKVGIGKSVSCV